MVIEAKASFLTSAKQLGVGEALKGHRVYELLKEPKTIDFNYNPPSASVYGIGNLPAVGYWRCIEVTPLNGDEIQVTTTSGPTPSDNQVRTSKRIFQRSQINNPHQPWHGTIRWRSQDSQSA